ncbi:MAG: hypothetical protein JNM95_06160 [Chitinophagaceae bacterium]|nr:hypothetical protein [Chitinophagaceae bacterium]
MKRKGNYLRKGLLLYCLLILVQLGFSQNSTVPCSSYYLDLSTGVNQESNQAFPLQATDPFWRIVSGPVQAGTYPHCALVVSGTAVNTSFGLARSIALGNGLNLPSNIVLTGNACNYTNQPYVFERDFKLEALPNGTEVWLTLDQLYVSDRVTSILLQGPGGPIVLLDACLIPGVYNLQQHHLVLNSGVYTLQVFVGKSLANSAASLPLQFSLKASIFANEKVFQDNQHFGRNTWCSPPYPVFEKPVMANTCVMAGDTSCEVIIDNYQSYLTYSLSNGSFTSPFTFQANLQQSYTLTASDSFGCTLSDSVFIDTCMIGSASFKLLLQGLMQNDGTMIPAMYNQMLSYDSNDVADIEVEFRKPIFPFEIVRLGAGRLKKDGSVWVAFNPIKSNHFYHVLKSKNILPSWSGTSKLLTSGAWYDYSQPGVLKGDCVYFDANTWMLYTGDLNQDGSIDLFDFFEFEQASSASNNNGLGDLNGDGITDVLDFFLLEWNLVMGPGTSTP